MSFTLSWNVSFADNPPNTEYEYKQLMIQLGHLKGKETRLIRYKGALSTLVGKWVANEEKIKVGTEVTLSGAFATSASALAAALSSSTPITAVGCVHWFLCDYA